MLREFPPVRAGLLLVACALSCAAPVHAGSLLDYVGECVPFARAASGVQLYGDAWTWWDQAAGKYARGSRPRVGAVIALARSPRLARGHVAVVSRVVDDRVLMVTHANWSRVGGKRGRVEQDVTFFDVSPRGDWSQVKVWYRDNRGLGNTVYPVHGFIYPAGRPVPGVSGANPDYVASLIDAYAR